MKKYWLIFTQNISQVSVYRFHLLLTFLQNLVQPAILLSVLFLVKPTSSVTFSQLVPYYLLIALVSPLTLSTIDEELDELTASGDINNFLLKPFSLITWLYTKALSEKLVMFIVLSLPLFVSVYFYHLNLFQILFLPIILLISFSLSFFLSFFVGISCFWIEDFWAIHNVKYVVTSFLGGLILPYQFFPLAWQSFLKYSPFPYLVTFPIQFIQSKLSPDACVIILVWLVLLIFASQVFLHRAIAKYSYVAT
jgi:ABC-2 type transport system permease protein